MRTNVKDLKEKYIGLFNEGIFKDVKVNIFTNDRKASSGSASLTIQVAKDEENHISTTMYVIERHYKDGATSEFVVFVNDDSHQVVFNGNSVNKAQNYIERYIENSTKRLLGIEIENTKPTPTITNDEDVKESENKSDDNESVDEATAETATETNMVAEN